MLPGDDAIRVIETLRTRQQKMATAGLGDRDAFGIKIGPAGAVVQIFQVRGGKVVERIELITDSEAAPGGAGAVAADSEDRLREVQEAALQQFYQDRVPPPEIHLPIEFPEADLQTLESWLSSVAERRVRLIVPRRGGKRGLLDLATRNAEVAYQQRFNENTAAHYDALETLRVVLGLTTTPRRIECFDISTIQGSETVASMVVCEDGRMKRSEYRKFRIRGLGTGDRGAGMSTEPPIAMATGASPVVDTPAPAAAPSGESARRAGAAGGGGAPPALNNDFMAMREVVMRRYRKLLEQGGPFPDLILVDGGKGQLSAAYSALEELGLGRLFAVGIAKKEELLFTRERADAVALPPDSPALLLIQRIRDEAHRFAVTFHRQSRTRRDFRSELDAIAGIGPRRRRALLTAFGSVAGVRRATREELVRVVGARCADTVLAHFASQGR